MECNYEPYKNSEREPEVEERLPASMQFEQEVRAYCTYLKGEGYSLDQIRNIIRNIAGMEVELWNESGGEI